MTSPVHRFRDHAMATHFEVRVAHTDATYAAQAAQACFARVHVLEAQLSRFQPQGEVRRIAALQAGESMRLSPDTFQCLAEAKRLETATGGGFSITAAALRRQVEQPRWSLDEGGWLIRCEAGSLEFDLGAIGKGFALDRVAELLREWECNRYLLVAGGSSILAGEAPEGAEGWSCGLGEDDSEYRLLLVDCSLSGSGVGVQGNHIVDPRTGVAAARERRAWALCDTATESDAVSTAAMVLDGDELREVLEKEPSWLVLLEEGDGIRRVGLRSYQSE